MEIAGTRFGTIEFDEQRIITLRGGLIGFPSDTRFILLEPPPGGIVACLQSVDSPPLAFPVVAGVAFGEDYPRPGVRELAQKARLLRSSTDDFAVLVVVAARMKGERIANLLAPIVVNVDTRTGAQIVLDPEVFSAATPFDVTCDHSPPVHDRLSSHQKAALQQQP